MGAHELYIQKNIVSVLHLIDLVEIVLWNISGKKFEHEWISEMIEDPVCFQRDLLAYIGIKTTYVCFLLAKVTK